MDILPNSNGKDLTVSLKMRILLFVLLTLNLVSSKSFQNDFNISPQLREKNDNIFTKFKETDNNDSFEKTHKGDTETSQEYLEQHSSIFIKVTNDSFVKEHVKNSSFAEIRKDDKNVINLSQQQVDSPHLKTNNVMLEVNKIKIQLVNTDEEKESVNLKNNPLDVEADNKNSKTISQLKEEIFRTEEQLRLGFNVRMSEEEKLVNAYLKQIKDEEYRNTSNFLASKFFFDVRDDIENSKVFRFIQKIPKGGLLHVHKSALGSSDILFELTKDENCYICNETGNIRFRFPNGTDETCDWKKLQNLRPNSDLDKSIKKSLTMFGNQNDYDEVSVWDYFESLFFRINPLLSYRPTFEKFLRMCLEENYKDNINYIEMRGNFNTLYELNGDQLDPTEVAGLFVKIVDEFKESHPNFYGFKIIYSTSRGTDESQLEEFVNEAIQINQIYPNLITGFDLVGQEDNSNSLSKFSGLFKNIPLNLFLHAGETNFFGLTDNNLYDAVLLNVKRIGHGLALVKHPKLLNLVKQKRIAVEVSPISNQVLKYVGDLRNHPATILMANDVNVVICNDDPGLWGAKGLSYDWYFALMALGHKDDDLRLLKKFALNSIEFSGLDDAEKRLLGENWKRQWNEFIDDMLKFIYV